MFLKPVGCALSLLVLVVNERQSPAFHTLCGLLIKCTVQIFTIIHGNRRCQKVVHLLDLEDYGVTKKWVIITEISKEVENNNIGRVNAYPRQYVPRRNVASGGSNAGGGSSSRS